MHRSLAHYDKAYFDKWYRHPKHRVKSPLDMRRQLAFVVSAAEYLLERPVRRVLDVGAGEGNWAPVLKRLRPAAKYYGVDGSDWAVKRWGRRRNIRLGTFGSLHRLGLPGEFDLVLCLGVLNYLAADEFRAGVRSIRGLLAGVAYFEIFTRADDATGDFAREYTRAPAWYRRELREAGYVSVGMHCYLPRELEWHAAALERAD
ncbi:MAG TPA: class I SAM-dependent methyltransferase [Gemmatimonadaceae bacterium]|nr:class I SAM-dependent methyltransferase [Gemmatimonadaceae bacterium]